jgi:hypothetical protein
MLVLHTRRKSIKGFAAMADMFHCHGLKNIRKNKNTRSWPGVSYKPYYIVNELKSNDVQDRIIGQISSTLKFNVWLSLMGRAGTDYYTQKVKRTWPVGAKRSENYLGRVYNEINIVKDLLLMSYLLPQGALEPLFGKCISWK